MVIKWWKWKDVGRAYSDAGSGVELVQPLGKVVCDLFKLKMTARGPVGTRSRVCALVSEWLD